MNIFEITQQSALFSNTVSPFLTNDSTISHNNKHDGGGSRESDRKLFYFSVDPSQQVNRHFEYKAEPAGYKTSVK